MLESLYIIGRCTQIFDDTIDVAWLEGSYTSLWKPWKVQDAINCRKVVDWVDRIPKGSILLFGFTLTATKQLPVIGVYQMNTSDFSCSSRRDRAKFGPVSSKSVNLNCNQVSLFV